MDDAEYRRRVKVIAGLTLAGAAYRNNITPGQYAAANELGQHERCVVRAITVWNHTGDQANLNEARLWLDELIASET